MTVFDPVQVHWGPPLATGLDRATGGHAWPDLDPANRSRDWSEWLRRLAELGAGGRPVVVLRNGVELTDSARRRLLSCARQLADGPAIIGALDNLDPALSPLPPGMTLSAPIPVADIDRLCAWLGNNLLFPHQKPLVNAAVWLPGAAEALLRAGWTPSQPLPDDLANLACDHVFAGTATQPLTGTAPWPANHVPPPTDPLEAIRTRWPADADGAALRAGQGVVPAGPVPGRDRAPTILHICHGWGGGSQRFIQDLAEADGERCHLLLTAHGDTPRQQFGEWLELCPAASPELLLARYPVHPPIAATTDGHSIYKQALASIFEHRRVDGVMVSSLIGHDLAALRTGKPTLVVCHDYYPLWPELHCDFGDPCRRFDQDELTRDLAAAPLTLFQGRDADRWWRLREAFIATLRDTRPTLVTPTVQVGDNWRRLAPELAGQDWQVIPHGIAPWLRTADTPAADPPTRDRLRILVPGRIAGGKGLNLLKPLLDRLDRRCELVLLGAGTSGAELHGHARVHVIADYRREDLPDHVARLAPDLALLPVTVAETFGYLLSELQSLGLPVLTTAIGSYAERVEDGVNGLLVQPDPDAIAARLHRLLEDRSVLATIRTHLAAHPGRDTLAMADDYRRALPLPAPEQAIDPRLPDWRDLGQAWLARRALEIDRHRDRLHDRLRASEAELERRAEWGFDLSRQLDERTAWATALDADLRTLRDVVAEREAWIDSLHKEIEHVRDQLQTVLGSRSWRLMAPARVAARKLRGLHTRLTFQLRRTGNLLHRGRLSLATRGLPGTFQHLRQRRAAAPSLPALPVQMAAPTRTTPPGRLPTSPEPLVSVIVPTYGKLAYTCACLAALAEHAGPTPFEVLVIDDASPERTDQHLAGVEGLRLIRNASNLGFVGSCNAGAGAARGRWLVFLNNDTTVTPGWLEALLATHEDFDQVGLVGARLIYPDGRLQEAGGLVFADGSGWNYGRFDDPGNPRYNFARATDYCSGAAILIERELFERLDGFDQRYAPAYYEDTDLAFKVRQAGLKVIYQPAATVIHFEGITSGTDTGAGIKRYQIVNHDKFRERWREQLERQPRPGTPVEEIVRAAPKGRILVIDATLPEPDQDSGSVRLLNLLRLLRESGRHVVFFPDNRAYVPGYTERLQRMGIEVLFHPWLQHPVDWMREHGPELGAVLVSRHYIAANYIDLVRQYAPRARFIFDTVDLHYLREERAAELTGSDEIARQAARTRAQEQRLILASDVTVVVSPAEQALLAEELPGARIDVLSNVHPVPGRRRGFEQRRDLMFVGGFQHPPNIDAVLWFCQEVFPHIRAALPDVAFHVIGSKMPPAIADLAIDGVVVHGYVEDLEPFLDDCRIAVAPLRYGAGVKGKINMSMSYGQAVVATAVAVEGMHLEPGKDVLAADDPAGFAARVVDLYQDQALWLRLSDAGIDNVRRHFSFDAARAALDRILAS